MARKRMIDPDFWTDEALGMLPVSCRLLFMGLISNADDEGRLRGNPALIRSTVFPYDEYTIDDVSTMLDQLESAGLIRRYTVDAQSFLDIPNFLKHQTINKPTPSKLPPFEDASDTPTEPLREDYGSPTEPLPPKLREEKRKEEKRIREPECANAPPSDPHSIMWEFLNILQTPIDDVPKRWQSKQRGAAKNMLAEGYSSADILGCAGFMASQSWRTNPFDLTDVHSQIGGWIAHGRPEYERPKSGNSRPRGSETIDAARQLFDEYAEHDPAGDGTLAIDR